MSTSSTIRLESCDGEIFVTEMKIAQTSGTIKNLLQDCIIAEDTVVPLPNVKAVILQKFLEYAGHHKDEPPFVDDDETNEKRTDNIAPWDVEFLKVDQGTLFEIILAANYLDAKGLLDVACKTVANMIRGKTPEDIRRTFNIKNDFTAAEDKNVRKENEWCEEK